MNRTHTGRGGKQDQQIIHSKTTSRTGHAEKELGNNKRSRGESSGTASNHHQLKAPEKMRMKDKQ